MAFMDWSPRLSVGVTEIDREHRELVDMLNDLHAAMASGKGKQVLSDVLDRLISYTVTHFAHEEEAMRKHGYGDAFRHINEHRELTAKAKEVQTKFQSGVALGLSIEVMDFLRDWLTSHIQGTDAKLGAFLNSKGVK